MNSTQRLAVLMFFAIPGILNADESSSRRLSVTGEGSAFAVPDMASFYAAVVTEDATAAAAMSANNEKVAQVIDVLTSELGIPKKDIQTSRFDVSPKYNQGRNVEERRIIGYTVTNQVMVRVSDLSKLGKILDTVIRTGSNQVSGIQFELSKVDEITDQARVEAVKDARRKAALYAEAAGVTLGPVLTIDESSVRRPEPRFAGRAMMAEAAVPIAEGQQEVNATVTIVFELQN